MGDALRILERSGAIAQAVLTKINRQQIPELRAAIEDLSIAGPKVLDFYAGFCAHRATCLKADGKDIRVLNLILSGNSDGTSETDPSKDLKPEK